MSLSLTPGALRACYDFLRETRPFRAWRLPSGDEVKFVVFGDRGSHGTYTLDEVHGYHVISISSYSVGQSPTLLWVMAHEMVHLHQQERGTTTRSNHNAEFKRLARRVCREHGFDYRVFAGDDAA